MSQSCCVRLSRSNCSELSHFIASLAPCVSLGLFPVAEIAPSSRMGLDDGFPMRSDAGTNSSFRSPSFLCTHYWPFC